VTEQTYSDALNVALHAEMARDHRPVLEAAVSPQVAAIAAAVRRTLGLVPRQSETR
jgi:hypothetical protein